MKPVVLFLVALLFAQSSVSGQDKESRKNITVINEQKKVKEFKVAVINMEKVFYSYYKTKIADANLKKQAEVYLAYAEKLNESRVKLQNEFRELRDASLNIGLSESEKQNKRLEAQDKYRQLKAKEAEYTQYNREKQNKLKEDYERRRGDIISEIQRIVRKRCILEGYSLVLDSSGRTLNNIASIVYNDPGLDITESILKELNRGHEDELKRFSDGDETVITIDKKNIKKEK